MILTNKIKYNSRYLIQAHNRARAHTNRDNQTHRLTYDRQDIRCYRQTLSDKHEEDSHREQRRDAHRHLLAGVARNAESEECHKRDEETREDHVEDMEERLPADLDSVRHIRIRFIAARVERRVADDV